MKNDNTRFWTERTVTMHRQFPTREHSLEYLEWRNLQYFYYTDLMPYEDLRGRTVLDYGCGPANDLVGFLEFSRPARLIGMDISPTALAEARERLEAHPGGEGVELVRIEDGARALPLDDGSVDFIHSSGVLHHTPNMTDILAEFRRVLAPGGRCRIMVYNRQSLYVHLVLAYFRRIVEKIDADLPLEEAFRRYTDGEGAPISVCFRPEEFIKIGRECGFETRHLGNAIHTSEMEFLPRRYPAIACQQLAVEHRRFLAELVFNEHGLPLHNGQVAGIDAVYELTPAR